MDLKNLELEDLTSRLSQLSKQYSELTTQLIPLLQKASNIENEIKIITEELTKRDGNA